MNDQFVLLLNKSYLNSGKPRNSGQFPADQTFHYIESTLYILTLTSLINGETLINGQGGTFLPTGRVEKIF